MSQLPGVALGNDGDVQGSGRKLQLFSEELANPALQAVTINGIANLAAYRQSHTGDGMIGRADYHYEMCCVIAFPTPPDMLIFSRGSNPAAFLEGLLALHPMAYSYLVGIDTERRLRPLARRRLITLAPFLVRMRLRNP